MRKSIQTLLGLSFGLLCGCSLAGEGSLGPAKSAPAAPEFTHAKAEDWLNSAPLRWNDLSGQVVLLDFWTFDCWNCYRSFPWLHGVEKEFSGKGLRVIGVHSPELPQERVRANVVKKVIEFKLTFPVMIDTDMSYWNAVGNHYWPALYLVDKHGRMRAVIPGETHAGDRNAKAIEDLIRELLAEPA